MSCTFCWQRCSWRNFETFRRNSDKSKTVEVQELGSLCLVLADQLHHELYCMTNARRENFWRPTNNHLGPARLGCISLCYIFLFSGNIDDNLVGQLTACRAAPIKDKSCIKEFSPRRAACSTRCIFPNHGNVKNTKKSNIFSLYSEAPYKIFLQNKEIILLIISKYCFNCKEEKHATKK